MPICPVCKNNEMAGALFCSVCGTAMGDRDPYETRSINRPASGHLASEHRAAFVGSMTTPGSNELPFVALRLVDSGHLIEQREKTEVKIGRAAEGQAQAPDVDLSAYDGYSLGVSRMHAVIKAVGDRFTISDLGSINGTRINGQKIDPQTEYPLNLGDMITLGKLRVQVIALLGAAR